MAREGRELAYKRVLQTREDEMDTPKDENNALQNARDGEDDEELREGQEEFNRVWPTMSEKQQEYWIGVLLRMLEEERLRFH